MSEKRELVRQGNTNLCLLYSFLNILETEEERKHFLMSKTREYDLEYIVKFIKALPHHQEKKKKNKKTMAEESKEEFPYGLMVKDIVEYCKHLQCRGVLRTWKIQSTAFSLENMLMPSKNQVKKGKAFLLTGATTTNKDIIDKRVKGIVDQREKVNETPWEGEVEQGVSRKRKREEEIEYCKGRYQAQLMDTKFREYQTKLRKADYAQHAIAMKYIEEDTLILLDPGKRVVKEVKVVNMRDRQDVKKAIQTITESLVDIYGIWSINLDVVTTRENNES